jgi:N utilization substance protein B
MVRESDRRRRARELAMQALYQLEVQGSDLLSGIGGFFAESSSDEVVLGLSSKWTRGTWTNLGRCDELIADSIRDWKISRLSAVDRSVLRLAVYQLEFCPDIPPGVVINEAIEIAKKYSTDQSPAFVNGVLDAVLKKLRAQAAGYEQQPGAVG